MSFEVPDFDEDDDTNVFEDDEHALLTMGDAEVMKLMENSLNTAAGNDSQAITLTKEDAIRTAIEMKNEVDAAFTEIESQMTEEHKEALGLYQDQNEEEGSAEIAVTKPREPITRHKVDMDKVQRGEVLPMCYVCEERHDFGECKQGEY